MARRWRCGRARRAFAARTGQPCRPPVPTKKSRDMPDFVAGVRACNTTPSAAQNIHEKRPSSAVDGRTTRHPGFSVSQVKRKLVKEGFWWEKTIGGLRKLQHRGTEKVARIFSLINAAYNLVGMRTLIRAEVCA